MKVSDLWRSSAIPAARLRQEIFALGDRHQGDALGGALKELKHTELTAEQRSLLRAVVAYMQAGGKAGEDVTSGSHARPATLADVAYIGVLIAAAAWVTVVVKGLFTGA